MQGLERPQPVTRPIPTKTASKPPATAPKQGAPKPVVRSPLKPALMEGLAARQAAAAAINGVLSDGRAFEDAFAAAMGRNAIAPRDRAFARAIAASALRRRGSLTYVSNQYLEKPLSVKLGRVSSILLSGAAQLLLLGTPPHAAISLAVEQCRADRAARRFDKLANAVLRRVSEKGADVLKSLDGVAHDIPPWLLARWRKTYGGDLARQIAQASLIEAPLDLTVKSDAAGWAEKLGGLVLPTGSVRLSEAGRIEELSGFSDGAWWVQDAAAAIPALLLGDVKGQDIADLCAAPGGKTAQLAAAGARVTSLDQSEARLVRLKENLARLKLEAKTVVADAAAWQPGRTFDGVLVDAPCTATGTIRRHPDILHLKRPDDVAALSVIQSRILAQAASLVKPGGRLVYCSCSLEPEEGVEQVARFLARHPDFTRQPVAPGDHGIDAAWITADGDIRTLPVHLGQLPPDKRGLDGFYAARLIRKST